MANQAISKGVKNISAKEAAAAAASGVLDVAGDAAGAALKKAGSKAVRKMAVLVAEGAGAAAAKKAGAKAAQKTLASSAEASLAGAGKNAVLSQQGLGKKLATESGKDLRIPIPGDADFIGPIKSGSWTLVPNGEGAHLVEKANVRGRVDLSIYDKPSTPRFYPYGSPENAGQAHIRLHEATRNEEIKLRGNPGMSDNELINHYHDAYNNPDLNGIRGDLRTPDSSNIVERNVTPSEAFEKLINWGESNKY